MEDQNYQTTNDEDEELVINTKVNLECSNNTNHEDNPEDG